MSLDSGNYPKRPTLRVIEAAAGTNRPVHQVSFATIPLGCGVNYSAMLRLKWCDGLTVGPDLPHVALTHVSDEDAASMLSEGRVTVRPDGGVATPLTATTDATLGSLTVGSTLDFQIGISPQLSDFLSTPLLMIDLAFSASAFSPTYGARIPYPVGVGGKRNYFEEYLQYRVSIFISEPANIGL